MIASAPKPDASARRAARLAAVQALYQMELTGLDAETVAEEFATYRFGHEPELLALGEPDHIITRTDATGASEIWSYTTYESTDGMPLYRGWYHRYYYWGDPMFPYYLDYPYRRERDHYRVTFKDGRAVSIEEHKQ